MQPKISKTLEGIIARSAFNTTKAGMTHSLKDFLTLELLREEGWLAYQLLSSRLKDWELYQVRLRIEREVISAKQQETRSPEEYTVGSILRLTEGGLAPVACLEQNPIECSRMSECRTLPMWRKLNTMINDYFDGITLADLVNTSQPGNDYVI